MELDQDGLTRWMNKAGAKPVLDQSEIDDIAKIIQSCEPGSKKYKKYVNKIVEHNLRLVVKFVHIFMNSKTMNNWGGPETLDYLQVGVLGLVRAAEKYDPTRGYKFSTYATHWIRSFVGRYNLKTTSIFTIPEHSCRNAYYFETHGEPKRRKSGVMPTDAETVEMVKLLRSAQAPVSLNLTIDACSGTTVLDTIEREYVAPDAFTEGCFDNEVEDLFVKARLSGKQIFILRGLFIDNAKAVDIQRDLCISQGQYLKLKKQAFDSLRAALDPV